MTSVNGTAASGLEDYARFRVLRGRRRQRHADVRGAIGRGNVHRGGDFPGQRGLHSRRLKPGHFHYFVIGDKNCHRPTPTGGVVEDSHGDLFGTTQSGGASNLGTVYEIVKGSGVVTTLVSFNGADGSNPYAGVVLDSGGDLFGAAAYGGAHGDGTVFEIVHGSHSITALASFSGANGQFPYGGVVLNSSGDIFGDTFNGGAKNFGTIFEIAKGTRSVKTLASFNGADGEYPYGGALWIHPATCSARPARAAQRRWHGL